MAYMAPTINSTENLSVYIYIYIHALSVKELFNFLS